MPKLSAVERLRRFYAAFTGDDRVLLPIVADPDAIASAMAVKRLLWRRVTNVTVASVNDVKRPDNLSMIRLLKFNLKHITEIDAEQFNRFVLVDAQPDHNELLNRFSYDVIVDHHPDTSPPAGFCDIRPSYGATATIMTEYLRAARIRPSYKLATALCHGIKVDTEGFVRSVQMEDVRAFQSMFRYANPQLAWKMEHAQLKLDFLKYFKLALAERRVRKKRIFVFLGPVISPDVCVILADFFMRIEDIQWCLVAGTTGGRLVVIFRNDGIRKNAGRVAKAIFQKIGSAGGHKSAARAEVNLSNLAGEVDLRDRKKALSWLVRIFEKRGKA